jgi:hypothetical protein
MRLASVNSEAAPPPARLGAIEDRIQELTMSRREVDLALKHLDSGKGIFRGFVPVSQGAGTAYLQRFQDKIVELEIKKRSMAARFTSRSSEMRAVNQEIKGIREGMREALGSQLVFLTRKVEDLQARRTRLAKTRAPVKEGRASSGANRPCSGRLNGRDSWYFAADGLYIITDRPSTVHRPVTAKAAKFTGTLHAYLFSPGSSPGTTAVAKAPDRANDHIALAGCVTINGLYTNRANGSPAGENSESAIAHRAPERSMDGHFRMVSTERLEPQPNGDCRRRRHVRP